MTKTDKIISIIILSFLIVIIIGLIISLNKPGEMDTSISALGRGNKGNIGVVEIGGMILKSDRIVDELEKFRKSERIKGIILKINSPGGGAAACWEIYNKVSEISKKSKPVVSYLGPMGASGAYYISVACDKIIANPSGITGSIGVIADIPVFYKLMEKIGVEVNIVKSGELKDIGSPYDEFTEEEKKILHSVVMDLYRQFFDAVADNRGLDKNYLNKLADGRIFTGLQAFDYGLVDTVGDFETAVKITAQLSGIEGEPKLVYIKKKKLTLLDLLFSDIEDIYSKLRIYPSLSYTLKLGGGRK
ncbi:MAG: signal peptide peptidase SppA [Candidatus Marinimicrobia bacterium]|nr:signal peptide peptidase SppA [Candidatus Neomarinimicrobiota bacterium]